MKNQFLPRLEWDTSQLFRKSLTSLRALTLLLVMCLSIGNVWGAWTDLSESLDLTGKSYGSSGYSGTLAYGDWTIVNGANNNKQWTYFKMGGKKATLSTANPCYIYYSANSGVSSQVDSITVHIPSGSLSKNGMSVNSWGVYVYSDKAMTSQVDYVAGGTISNAAADFGFKPSTGKTWAKAYYYKVSWDLANTTTTNGIVCVDKITLHANGGGGSDPELSVSPETITFDPVDVGTSSVTGKDVTVTMANLDAVLIGFSTNSPFQVDKDELTASGTVTVTPKAATLQTAGEYADDLTITDGDKLEKTVAVSIKVNALSAPNFTTQPVGASYEKDATPSDLSVVAEGAPSPAYQWYSNTKSSTEGASSISGATTASYTPSTATIGTTYYYCVATNSQGSATSDIVAVEVTAALPSITIQQADAGISGTYSTSTFKKGEVTFGFDQWCTSTTFIQAKKDITGSLYNSDAIPGNIRSIEFVTGSSKTPRTVIVKAGLTSDASSMTEITAPAESMNMVYDFGSTTKYKYFQMSTPSNACYFDKIIIKYQESTDPSIIVTPDSLHFEALDNGATDTKKFGIDTAYITGVLSAAIIDDADSKFSAAAIVNDSVAVTFTPGAVGNFSAKLVVKSMKSDVVEASDTVILTGEGLDSNVPVTGVTINKHALSLEKGATETLTVTITPDNASVKTVTWSSDNTEVATVDANGLVTAVKKGTANIIATSNNGIKDTCVVTVTLPAYWEKVTAAKDNWAGEYLLVYENNNTAYVWTGIDNAQCYNDTTITDGQIMQPAGTVTVTLAAMDGGYSIQINGGAKSGFYLSDKSGKADLVFSETAVAFTPSYATNCTQLLCSAYSHYLRFNSSSDQMRFRFYAESGQKAIQLYEKASTEPSVKLNKKSTSLSVGAKETLTATVKNSEATVVWSTLDDQIASVNNGEVTAVAQGETKIIATITEASVNYADTCVVTVTPAATVTSVTIDPEDATLYIYGTTPTKQSATFTATVVGENEPAQTVTWKSLDEEVATVSEAGVVSAVAAGTTKIVAISTVDDTKSDTADVVVKVFENTAATAYTTAEAIELIDALGTAIKDIQVYVKGVVSKNDGIDNGAITYWLDEDAFEVYKGKGVNGDDFASVDDIKVGDHVVVLGKLKKYNSTYEFDANSQLVSRKTAAVLAWSAGAYTAELGLSSYDYPTLTKTPSNIEGVVYESSNTEAATINAETGEIALVAEGNTTIKASFAGNDTLFAAQDATYELSVKAEVVRYTITYNSNGGSEIAPVADQTNLPSTFPTPTKDFKVFGGWYFDNNVFEVPAVADMPLTKDTTLYAKWDEPKSITEMIALIPTSGDEVDNVYGWGYIKAGATVSSGYANYYITDGSDNDFYIYKGLNVNGESFTSADQLPSGNKVMIYGDIKNYNGTPEFTQGSRIINNAAVEVPVTGVSLNKAEAEVMVGKNVTLVATVAPSHATNQNVSWSSNKESIAMVDATGKVTGVAAGDATITVTTEDGGFQASCAVTVVAAPTFDNGIWVKVTNTDDLTADSYVIIAAKNYTKAIKTYVSGNNHGAQDVTVSGEILSYTTAPAIFQVKDYVKESATVGKAFLNIESGNYLYLPDNNNKLTETASMEDKSAFTFAITDGVHSLTNYSLTGRQMKYNNSSSCFACYTSGQDNIVVYKYMEGAFALSFDANGGQKTSVPGSMIVQGAVTIPSDVPTHATAGTKFAYYTPDKAGEGTHYVPGQENCEFTQNTTLYAQWNVLTARHITYNAGGGTGSVPTDAVNYYEGDSVTLKAATNLSNPGHIFSSWEVSYNNGEKQIVEVSDNNKFAMPDYDVTATAIWTAKTNDKWVLVTSEEQLVAGEKYVIACNSKGKVAGDINGTYLEQKDATFSSDDMYIKGMTDKLVLTLGGETDAWTFTNEDSEVLGATAEKALSFTNGTTTWKISVSSTATTIQNTNTDYGYMKYNASSPRFTTYKNSGTAIQLYRMIPAVVVEDETVNASDLNDYANITVGEGGNLTLTSGEKVLGDVYVMAGGKVTIDAEATLTVTNFVIKSVMAGGKSGQVIGVTASNLVISGDAYYDVTLDGNADPDKWHAVGVPFDVDAINGIYDMEDNKLVNETNYSIMVYKGDVRAQGKYGWDKIHRTNDKIMHPGVFYLFGVDGSHGTTYRFKMNGGFSLQSKSIMTYEYPKTGEGVATDAGWNGIGNTQLEYSAIDKPVQVLNISTYTFVAKTASSTNFTVGTPFFYQAEGTGYVTLVTGEDKPAYAPTRMGNEAKDIDVTLANEKYTDHLYLSATDEATNEYQIGRDLAKMTMTSTPVVPQIFAQAYGVKLCMVDAPMVNNQASYSVLLYAPTAGEYTMDAAQVEGYEVFLTKDGAAIWNLSMSAATVELAKGNNTGYGIVIKKAPQVTTDMENVFGNAESIQKFIFNDNLYIIRGENVFDAQGKLVK